MLQRSLRQWLPPQTQREIASRVLTGLLAPTKLSALLPRPPPCWLLTLEYVQSGQLASLPEIHQRRHRPHLSQVRFKPVIQQLLRSRVLLVFALDFTAPLIGVCFVLMDPLHQVQS
jgi:hypothetical protein